MVGGLHLNWGTHRMKPTNSKTVHHSSRVPANSKQNPPLKLNNIDVNTFKELSVISCMKHEQPLVENQYFKPINNHQPSNEPQESLIPKPTFNLLEVQSKDILSSKPTTQLGYKSLQAQLKRGNNATQIEKQTESNIRFNKNQAFTMEFEPDNRFLVYEHCKAGLSKSPVIFKKRISDYFETVKSLDDKQVETEEVVEDSYPVSSNKETQTRKQIPKTQSDTQILNSSTSCSLSWRERVLEMMEGNDSSSSSTHVSNFEPQTNVQCANVVTNLNANRSLFIENHSDSTTIPKSPADESQFELNCKNIKAEVFDKYTDTNHSSGTDILLIEQELSDIFSAEKANENLASLLPSGKTVTAEVPGRLPSLTDANIQQAELPNSPVSFIPSSKLQSNNDPLENSEYPGSTHTQASEQEALQNNSFLDVGIYFIEENDITKTVLKEEMDNVVNFIPSSKCQSITDPLENTEYPELTHTQMNEQEALQNNNFLDAGIYFIEENDITKKVLKEEMENIGDEYEKKGGLKETNQATHITQVQECCGTSSIELTCNVNEHEENMSNPVKEELKETISNNLDETGERASLWNAPSGGYKENKPIILGEGKINKLDQLPSNNSKSVKMVSDISLFCEYQLDLFIRNQDDDSKVPLESLDKSDMHEDNVEAFGPVSAVSLFEQSDTQKFVDVNNGDKASHNNYKSSFQNEDLHSSPLQSHLDLQQNLIKNYKHNCFIEEKKDIVDSINEEKEKCAIDSISIVKEKFDIDSITKEEETDAVTSINKVKDNYFNSNFDQVEEKHVFNSISKEEEKHVDYSISKEEEKCDIDSITKVKDNYVNSNFDKVEKKHVFNSISKEEEKYVLGNITKEEEKCDIDSITKVKDNYVNSNFDKVEENHVVNSISKEEENYVIDSINKEEEKCVLRNINKKDEKCAIASISKEDNTLYREVIESEKINEDFSSEVKDRILKLAGQEFVSMAIEKNERHNSNIDFEKSTIKCNSDTSCKYSTNTDSLSRNDPYNNTYKPYTYCQNTHVNSSQEADENYSDFFSHLKTYPEEVRKMTTWEQLPDSCNLGVNCDSLAEVDNLSPRSEEEEYGDDFYNYFQSCRGSERRSPCATECGRACHDGYSSTSPIISGDFPFDRSGKSKSSMDDTPASSQRSFSTNYSTPIKSATLASFSRVDPLNRTDYVPLQRSKYHNNRKSCILPPINNSHASKTQSRPVKLEKTGNGEHSSNFFQHYVHLKKESDEESITDSDWDLTDSDTFEEKKSTGFSRSSKTVYNKYYEQVKYTQDSNEFKTIKTSVYQLPFSNPDHFEEENKLPDIKSKRFHQCKTTTTCKSPHATAKEKKKSNHEKLPPLRNFGDCKWCFPHVVRHVITTVLPKRFSIQDAEKYNPYLSAERQMLELFGTEESKGKNILPEIHRSSPIQSSPISAFVKYSPKRASSVESLKSDNKENNNVDTEIIDFPPVDQKIDYRKNFSLSSLSLCSVVSLDSIDCNKNSFNSKLCDDHLDDLQRTFTVVESKSNRGYSKPKVNLQQMLYGPQSPEQTEQITTQRENSNSNIGNLEACEAELLISMLEFEKMLKSSPSPPSSNETSPNLCSSSAEKRQDDEQDAENRNQKNLNNSIDSAYSSLTRSSGADAETGKMEMSKFCHECGTKYPIAGAKFCCNCGMRRISL